MSNGNVLISDVTAFRTYAKFLQHLGRRETLEETITRNMQMHLDRFPKLSSDIVKAYQRIYQKKVMPSMRSMQFAGEAILKNNARLFNCSFANIDDPKVFSESLFLLLSGVGFGFSVQKRHINKLPKLQTPRETGVYLIHDSIQGWADSLNVLMEAYFYGKMRPEFDFSSIRQKGSYLVTTGAKAPGPEPLKIMLKQVEDKLKLAIGRKLTPIEVHDMECIISDAVLAGGIRRAALISLFDKDDEEMLKCKHGNWWEKHPYRARANNSVVLHREETSYEEFMNVYKMCRDSGSGEPGFYWTNDYDLGTNPCCFTGDMQLLTINGYATFSNLVNSSFLAYNKDGAIVKAKVWYNGIKKVIELHLTNGEIIKCTPDHRFMLKDGSEVEAKDTLGLELNPYIKEDLQTKVWLIKELGETDVYDFSLDDNTHWGVVNGVIAHNCEIGLQSNQFCNLTSVNQSGVKDKRDFLNRIYAASLIGTLQASYTDFHYLRPVWKFTTEQESLLGVSFTGIADGDGIITEEWLREGAKHALDVNEKYSKKLGINKAARVTAVKPEGTASCILSSSSGIHARHAPFYIRRIRMNKDDALAVYLKNTIPELVEDDKFSSNGVVISIPQKSPENSIIRHNETANSLLDRTLLYNDAWVKEGHRSGINTHNVSVTISVRDEEWDSLGQRLWDNRDKYNGISLLPFSDHTYIQAPFEDCTEDQYNEMSLLVKDIDLTLVKEEQDFTNRVEQLACSNGVCEIT